MSLVENLYRSYDDFTVQIPRWEIADQGISVLSGPSGAGKTSVFRLLTGIEKPQSLSWHFDGVDLAKLPVNERRLGVVFQTVDLFPHMTAEENILFAAQARGISSGVVRRKMDLFVSALGMSSFLSRRAAILSGGEQQRVALARALIGDPRIVLLDEPFSALDEDTKEESRRMVKALIEEEKKPVLLITHDRRDIDALADHVFRIEAGRLLEAAGS